MQEQRIQVWLDCDPGLDDTFAIILAARSERINLVGISTSAGNTNIENTTRNALDVLFNVHRDDVLVVKGSETLVQGQLRLAQHMHGQNGLGGVSIPPSSKTAVSENNFSTIRDMIMKVNGKIIWANTGAFTNLCKLFQQFPQTKTKIDQIVFMGGALGRGNITPAAEFNIYFDPVAFKRVLESKGEIPVVMIPLELTHEVKAKDEIFNFLEKRDRNPFAFAILNMLRSYKTMYYNAYKFQAPPLHDPCVINYILHPENFEKKKSLIEVDVAECSYGRTNVYFQDKNDPTKQPQSVDLVCVKMRHRRHFWALFEKIFAQIFVENDQQ